MKKNISKGVIITGILNIIIGSYLLLISIGFLIVSPLGLLAIFYSVCGVGILFLIPLVRKIVVVAIIPLTFFVSIYVLNFPDVSEEYNYLATPLSVKVFFIVLLGIYCFFNFYFFTRSKVKEQFCKKLIG